MLFAPSPQTLLHTHDTHYGANLMSEMYNRLRVSPDLSNPGDSQLFIDLGYLCFNGDSPQIKKSHYNSSYIVAVSMNTDSPSAPLFLALQVSNTEAQKDAIDFFEGASQKGSIEAMNSVGKLYVDHPELFQVDSIADSYQKAIKWHINASRLGSTDSYKYLGKMLFSSPRFQEISYMFSKHFLTTKSIYSAYHIGKILDRLSKNSEMSIKWFRFCASRGHFKAALHLSRNSTSWKRVIQPFCFHKSLPKTLSANLSTDFSAVPFYIASQLLNLTKPFSNPNNTQQYIKYSHSFQPITAVLPVITKKQKVIPDCLTKTPCSYIPQFYYPSTNKTQLLFQLFNFASPDFEERNLNLASLIISRIYDYNSRGIVECKLWRNKCKSKVSDDLVRCGFISCLLNDNDYALSLFQKASKMGNLTGSLMTGLLLYHYISPRKTEDACYFFAKCTTDIIALFHIYLNCNDNVSEKRIKQMIEPNKNEVNVLEEIGDYLAEGVKFPKNYRAAAMFYGMAMAKAEKIGEETNHLIYKINQVYTE